MYTEDELAEIILDEAIRISCINKKFDDALGDVNVCCGQPHQNVPFSGNSRVKCMICSRYVDCSKFTGHLVRCKAAREGEDAKETQGEQDLPK